MLDHDKEETKPAVPAFDFEAFPADTLFVDRRGRKERRGDPRGPGATPVGVARARPERRERKERRRRIDPTTFEKQYTDDEIEFMNAMQRFKVQSGKSFPSHGEVLQVALSLGYRKVIAVGADDSAEQVEEMQEDGAIGLATLSADD